MRTTCTVFGGPIHHGDAVCLAGFDPVAQPRRPALVTKATAATLGIARWLLGIADTGKRTAYEGEAVDVWLGDVDLTETDRAERHAPRVRGPLAVDVSYDAPFELEGALATFDAYEIVGRPNGDAWIVLPQEHGWSATFVDRTGGEPGARTVTLIADVNGTRVTTARGRAQRVHVELYGGNFNVRAA